MHFPLQAEIATTDFQQSNISDLKTEHALIVRNSHGGDFSLYSDVGILTDVGRKRKGEGEFL